MLYINAETFDFRLRATSKFLLFQLLHVNCDASVYQSTGQCMYISVPNLISPGSFLDIYLYIIHIKETEIMNSNKEIYIYIVF